MIKQFLACVGLSVGLAASGALAADMIDLGGAAKGDPSAVWYKFGGQDVVAVFVRGPGELMYARVGDEAGTNWTQWTPIGDLALKGSPACIAVASSAIECVGVGPNNNVHYIRYNAKKHQWTGWQNIGGFATADPGVAKGFDGGSGTHLNVFVSGPGNELFVNSREDGDWTGWEPLGVTVGGNVACTDILGIGDHCYDSSGGSAVQLTDVTLVANDTVTKENLGGAVTHKVSAVATGAKGNTLRVFVNGPGQRIWMKKWQGQWQDWTQLGALAGNHAPACTIRPSGGTAYCAINEGGTVKAYRFAASEL